MKRIDKWKRELQAHKKMCQEWNGLPYCKNCGIDFDELIEMIEKEIKEAIEIGYNNAEREKVKKVKD